MSLFKIVPKILHGISIEIPDSVQFLSDQEILYPSGGVLTVQNIVDKSQKFIKIRTDPEKNVNLLIVHPEKTFVAIASIKPKPIIEIYDLNTQQLAKSIPVAASVITMTYSWDGEHLLYVTSEPEPIMYYYSFDLGKVENITGATQPPAYLGPVTKISGNPADSMIVVIVGSGLFRLLNLSDSVWRQYGFQKAETYNFLTVSWISSDKLIAGTSDGRIILVDSGELKGVYRAGGVDLITPATSKEELQAMCSNIVPKGTVQKPIVSMISFRKGFAFTIKPNRVLVFEKESNDKYIKKNEFFVESDEIRDIPQEQIDNIFSISMSPDQKTLICCTGRAQLYSAHLSDTDNFTRGSRVQFQPIGEKLHYGKVSNLSVCVWKSLIMTSGAVDRRICLFNYEKNKLVFSQYFNNDVHGLVIHTTGLFCAIGFTDVCQISYIMMDRLELAKTLSCKSEKQDYSPIRGCKVLEFSSFGHMLAVANGIDVQLFDAIQFHLLFTLQGHRLEITALKWILTDTILLSCGLDGAVYLWDVKLGKRMGDIVSRHNKYHDITATSDGQLIYTVGEDGRLKEIKNHAVIQDLEVTNCSLTKMVMSKNDQLLMIADSRGLVLVVNYPVVQKVDYEQYCVHTKLVTNMRISFENTHIVTSDEDGMVCIWKILYADGSEIAAPKDLYRCPDILIEEEELIDKTETIENLRARNKEIEFEQKFKIKELYRAHQENLEKLKTEREKMIKILNEKIKTIENDKLREVAKLTNEKQEMMEKYSKDLDAIEKHLKYNLLIREYEKSKSLQDKLNQIQEAHKEELETLEKKFKDEMRKIKEENETEITKKNEHIETLIQNINKELQNQETMKRIVEDDADRTIMEMQALYEEMLAKERALHLKVKNEEGVCKEKIKLLEKEIQTNKTFQLKLEKEISMLESQNLNYVDRIDELCKEIVERENILIPKERRVHVMKSRLAMLEQEIRILKMKNQEFAKKIQPKDEEIAENAETIHQLKQEILDIEKNTKHMHSKIQLLQESINAKNKICEEEIQKQVELKALLNKMKNDIFDVHEAMKEQKPQQLRIAVQKLHDKYVKGKNIEILLKNLKSVTNENFEQRKHLTNTIQGLKRHIARKVAQPTDENILTKEQIKLQDHNEELKTVHQRKLYELNQIQEKLSRDGVNIAIHDKIETVIKDNEELHAKCQQKVKELESTIQTLQSEMFELKKTIIEKEKVELDTKISSTIRPDLSKS